MAPSTVAVGLFGVGLIGKAFMRQLAQQAEFLQEQLNVQPLVVAVANSRRMVLSAGGLQHTDWQAALTTEGGGSQAADPDALARHVAAHAGAAAGVVLDCTASAALPAHYARWVSQHGLSIVTPNKQLGAGPWARYAELRSALRGAAPAGAHFMYEATVGAGLPVISTLRGLLETGDRVARVEGVLSGTLSYLFNGLAPGVAFSGVVGAARALGYTEPDPREDLSGADVARKVVILARECGLQLAGADELAVSSLVPRALAHLSVNEFMQQLPQHDADMSAQAEAAAARGCVMRYVGTVDVQAGTASVSVQEYPAAHPFAQLQGSENMVVFTTERYPAATPLVVRGPGAGAEVTAAGVFSDLLAVCRYSAGART